MWERERQALPVFRRVRDFLKDHAPDAALGPIDGLVAQLDETITQFEAHAAEQEARRRIMIDGTRLQWQALRALRREFMLPISRIARLVFPTQPTLLLALRMPEGRDYVGTLTSAEAMAEVARQHAGAFREIGLGEDFVQRMQEAVTSLRTRLDGRAVDFGRRSAATAGLRREYARGRDVVRVLDAMVAPRLESTPERAAEWRTLVRFMRINATRPDVLPDEPSVTTLPSPPGPAEVNRAA